MCEPATIVALTGLALSAAATTYTVYEGNQTVKAQNRINQQAADEGAALAADAFKQQAGQVRQRDAQLAEAASQEKQDNAKRAAGARETARVSSGEAGISGVSIDQLIADFNRQELGYDDAVNQNLSFDLSQNEEELKGLRSGAHDRAIASKRPKQNRPSYLAAGLSVAAQSVGTYDNYKMRTDKSYRGEG